MKDDAAEITEVTGMAKEPWDYEMFVRFYNEIATQRGGYRFRGDRSPQKLLEKYQRSTTEKIHDFADALFMLDQEY